MSYKDPDAAFKAGKYALAEIKNYKGWEIHVWENLGYHVKLVKGGMKLYIDVNGSISSLFGHTYMSGGIIEWDNDVRSDNANIVIDAQLKIANDHVQQLQLLLAGHAEAANE